MNLITFSLIKKRLKRCLRDVASTLKKTQFKILEHIAMARFARLVGDHAVFEMKKSLALSENYRRWDAWSLSRIGILKIAELVMAHDLQFIVEFGSGYSTIAIANFLKSMKPNSHMYSFEHQAHYLEKVRCNLNGLDVTLYCQPLIQLTDVGFDKVFIASDPNSIYLKNIQPVPLELYNETRLRNTFYNFDFNEFKPNSLDLMIVDGPNGNGRSLAFPLLKQAMRVPSWVLIDDYLDYPFVNDFKRAFDGELEYCFEMDNEKFVVFKITGRR